MTAGIIRLARIKIQKILTLYFKVGKKPKLKKCLKDLVKDAWCKDLEKVKKSETINHIIDYLKNEAPEYKFSGNKIGLKQYEVVSISLKYRGYLYQTILDYCFDSNKSIKENTEDINKALENKGWKIRISERTIYKYNQKIKKRN